MKKLEFNKWLKIRENHWDDLARDFAYAQGPEMKEKRMIMTNIISHIRNLHNNKELKEFIRYLDSNYPSAPVVRKWENDPWESGTRAMDSFREPEQAERRILLEDIEQKLHHYTNQHLQSIYDYLKKPSESPPSSKDSFWKRLGKRLVK